MQESGGKYWQWQLVLMFGIVIGIVVGIVVGAMLIVNMVNVSTKSLAGHFQLGNLWETIALGDSIAAVDQRISELPSDKMRIRRAVDEGHGAYAVQAPFVFIANEWILWIRFQDSKVVGKHIRIADSETVHPTGAPADVAEPDAPELSYELLQE